jgi:hypothetical protein
LDKYAIAMLSKALRQLRQRLKEHSQPRRLKLHQAGKRGAA